MDSSLWPPQLWDLGSDGIDEVMDQAADLAVAESGDIGLADRWRAWRGCDVRVQVAGAVHHGQVELVFRDAVLLGDVDRQLLIPWSAIALAEGPSPGPALPPSGRERGSGLSVAREWVGELVSVALASDIECHGLLMNVGADHLELHRRGPTALISWVAVRWLRHTP